MINFDDKNYIKNILKGCLVIFLYFFISIFKVLPLQLLHIDYNNLSIFMREVYNISLQSIILIAIFFIFKDYFIKAFKDLKKNHLNYFKSNFKYYLIGVLVMMASNALINVLGGGIADNEASIRTQFTTTPIYIFISAVLLAPLLEESVFRLSFRHIFKNKFVFVIMSGFAFGTLHLTGVFDNPLMPLYLLAYSSCGLAFAYILAKTDNIFVTMGFHAMHNGILLSLQFFISLIA